MKKHLALFIALIMIFQMFPVSVFAEDGAGYEEYTAAAVEAPAAEEAAEEAAPAEVPAERGWSSVDSEAIEAAEYHTVTFKDRGITRSKRAVEDGAAPGSVPGDQDGRPNYGWTVSENGGMAWFDESAAITENTTVTSVPANTEPVTGFVPAASLNIAPQSSHS